MSPLSAQLTAGTTILALDGYTLADRPEFWERYLMDDDDDDDDLGWCITPDTFRGKRLVRLLQASQGSQCRAL